MRKTVQILLILVAMVFAVFSTESKQVMAIEASNSAEVTSVETINNSQINEERENKTNKWQGLNIFRTGIQKALDKGVSVETIVLLLELPLIATLVSVLHYMVGLTGYGIFMPTMIAVTFSATGVFQGLLLFGVILTLSLLCNVLLNKLKIHFWPARTINLLFISIGTLVLMMLSTSIKFFDLSNISIFPVLFMIMLVEEFVRTQLVKSKREAKRLTLGTLVLSITGAVTMGLGSVRSFVLNYPELMIFLVLVINLVVGNYTGIRLSEIGRFKKAIRDNGKKVKIKN